MTVTAAMVKDLRDKTGAGMMDCKKALAESAGNVDAAVKYLREKGLAAAAKKAGRVAAEGLVGLEIQKDVASLVEVNCETDFVAKNDDFKKLVNDLVRHVVKNAPAKLSASDAGTGPALLDQPFVSGKTVNEAITEKVATIGENISLRRFVRFAGGSTYGSYLHGAGNIGVLVEFKVKDSAHASSTTMEMLARDVAMHVASENPLAITRDEIDPAVVASERSIYRARALEQGKPENIVDKIVDGQVNKFLSESCLLDQAFIKDPDTKVSKLLEKVGKELGTTITVSRMARFKVGDGIEKKQDNLAEEVAKMTA